MTSKRTTVPVVLATLLLFACKERDKSEAPPSVSPSKSEAPVAGQQQDETLTPSLAKHMQDHFTRGARIRDAVIAGDLETAKQHAQWMAEHQVSEDFPESWQPHVRTLQDAAKGVLDAQNIATAATHTAAMGRACGECHAKLGGPKLELGQAPGEGSGSVPHMARHQWAAERMWDALTVPSEEAWRKAAEVMADAPLTPEAVQGARSVPPKTEQLAKQVHDIAEAARADRQMEKWSSAYGSFLSTCADCHQALQAGASKGQGSPQ